MPSIRVRTRLETESALTVACLQQTCHVVDVSEIEVGVRELRNRTARVIAALDEGHHVVLTNDSVSLAAATTGAQRL